MKAVRLHAYGNAGVLRYENAPVSDEIARLVDGGKPRPLIGARFGLEDIASAHALSKSGRARGKIALHVAAA